MGIIREYTGDFTVEQNYLKNISNTVEEELKEISNIINSIQGDGIWDSIGAEATVTEVNRVIPIMEEVRVISMENANKIFDGIDTLLAVYDKWVIR